MAVMRKLAVGGVTYDTVGEASVNAVVSSGTKIATVTIDGTATDLYAPGGSTVTVTQSLSSGTQVGSISVDGTSTALYAPTPPTASTTAPSMDGTASYGSGTSYARSNHVHPTDTSRQAALVSGTNIKTINGNSLLGSGDLTVGGSVTMTDTEVDAAVDAAFFVPQYSVTIHWSAAGSVTVDDAEPFEGDTVTVTVPNKFVMGPGETLCVCDLERNTLITLSSLSVIPAGSTFPFTMPAQDVMIAFN